MEEQSSQVTDLMQKGTYFSEALSWYNSRFVFIHSQFSQLLVICLISVAALLFAFFSYTTFLPVTDKRLYVVFNPITPDYKLSVRALLSKPGEDADYALSKYLIEEYVVSRESYSMERAERNFNYVYAMSDGLALEEYVNYVSPTNLQSPFVVYANRGRRNVIVNWVKFYDENNKEVKAVVNGGYVRVSYTAQENFGQTTGTPQNYVAELSYNYANIVIDQETEILTQKPEMIITEYITKTDSGGKK